MTEVVITTDRTMMTNHHGKEFIGFMTTAPPIFMPEWLWMKISAPKMKVNEKGEPWQAPYGLRKIEAALLDAGIDAAVIDPDHLRKHIDEAKVIAIGHHDYFALGPPSSEWWVLTGKEPVNSKSFRKLMERPEIRKAKKNGARIIVGGPAAWQWLYMPELIEIWGVDTVIDGEGEKVVVEVVRKVLSREELPKFIQVGVEDVPSLQRIPLIKKASVNGLVEISRGCPRHCKFCSVTLRPLRHYTLEMIERELEVNKRAGVEGCILHSDDVLLYGSDSIYPKPDPIIKLHELARRYFKSVGWSHFSLSAVKYAEENYNLMSRLSEMLLEDDDYVGVEVGIETGSPDLAEKIMPAKALPYSAKEWPSIVIDAFSIMHDLRIVPAATLIVGIPEEKPEDVTKSLELVDELKPYRSLIVPMYFVPMGFLMNKDWYRAQPTQEQMDLMKACLRHDLLWIDDLARWYLRKVNPFLRLFIRIFISLVKRAASRYLFI